MKLRTYLLVSVAIAALFSMGSCTKNYTCHCDIIYSGVPGLPDSSTKEYTITDTKSGAKSKCTGNSGTYNNNDSYTDPIKSVETCYLY